MAPVDLKRNRESMLAAHKEVSDPASPTNWALFGYEGVTDVLKFLCKGDGGIAEFVDELNNGRMMYAYLKILDPNTNLSKFVFVNWQPEGVPETRKGACASHVRDIETLLRGAHVTINARTEDDVEEELIKSKVAKASGANYSVHKEKKQAVTEIAPVGSVYQKIKPQVEIKPQLREKFWEATQKEEQNRLIAEKQRQKAEKERLDKETKERELKSTKARDEAEAERTKAIRGIRDAEKSAATQSKPASQPGAENPHQEALRDEDERRGRVDRLRRERAEGADEARRSEEERAKRSEQMRQDRAAEAKSLVGARTTDARAMFEQKPSSQFDQPGKGPAPPRKIKSSFLDESNNSSAQPAAVRKQPIQLPPREASPPADESIPSPPAPRQPAASPGIESPAKMDQQDHSERWPPKPSHDEEEEEEEEDGTYDDVRCGATKPEEVKEEEEEDIYDDAATPARPALENPPVRGPGEGSKNLLAQGLPKRPASDDEQEQEDQDWEAPPTSEVFESSAGSSHGGGAGGHMGGHGVSAKALYDYQAAEDNEITFDPDDIITDVDQIDEGWWMGTAPDGTRGMFPSNYVEIM